MGDDIENNLELQPTATVFERTAEFGLDTVERAILAAKSQGVMDGLPSQAARSEQNSMKEYFWPYGLASLTVQTSERRPPPSHSPNKPHFRRKSHPSRWQTSEFYVYYAILGFGVWKMITVALELSKGLVRGLLERAIRTDCQARTL